MHCLTRKTCKSDFLVFWEDDENSGIFRDTWQVYNYGFRLALNLVSEACKIAYYRNIIMYAVVYIHGVVSSKRMVLAQVAEPIWTCFAHHL